MQLSDVLTAGIGAISALLGVALGAWWQARSSRQLLLWQSQQAAESLRYQTWHAQIMRIFEDKRQSYAQLITVATQYGIANSDLRLHGNPIGFHTLEDYDTSPEHQVEVFADGIDRILNDLEIIAPAEVYETAIQLCLAAMVDNPRLSEAMHMFMDLIRRDLGTNIMFGTPTFFGQQSRRDNAVTVPMVGAPGRDL